MKPEFPPDTVKIYQLVKRNAESMYFSNAGMNSGMNSIGIGFYITRDEAEYQRTLEVLKSKTEDDFYVFELEIPNPILK